MPPERADPVSKGGQHPASDESGVGMAEHTESREQLLAALEDMLMQLARRHSGSLIAGLTVPQFMVLRWVGDHGAVAMGTVADQLGISLGGATGLVDRLVQAGLLERQRITMDRRVVLVTLTTRGRAVLDQARTERFARLRAITAGLSTAELETLRRLLGRILASAAAKVPEGTRPAGNGRENPK